MQLNVSRLGPQRGNTLPVDLVLSGERSDLAGPAVRADLRLPGRVELHGALTRVGECVLLRATVRADVALECDRCAADFALDIQAPVEHLYCRERPQSADRDPDDVAGDGEPEVTPYTGEVIDAGEAVREALLLALPMKRLCRDDCKGLCPHCGADWNQGACDCRPESIDPRLAILAQALDNEDSGRRDV